MARRLVLLIGVVLLLVGMVAVQQPVKASSTATLTGKVLVARLRLRDGASIRGKILSVLTRNTMLTVIGRSARSTWLKVQTSTGMVGWVSTAFVRLSGGKLSMLPAVQ